MNREKTKLYAAVAARDAGAAAGLGLPCLGLFYRIGETGALQRARLNALGRGGLLGIYEAPGLDICQPDRVARDIQAECARRGLEGAVLDFVPTDPSRLEGLCAALRRLQVPLWVPEELAAHAGEGAVILCPAAVSGGSFDELLEALCARWGRENLCLDLVRTCREFSMPADGPEGAPLSPADFQRRLADTGAQCFFDGNLCCKYFTWRKGTEMRFVLFDDTDTAAEKLTRIRRAGIGRVCLLYSEWGRDIKALAET